MWRELDRLGIPAAVAGGLALSAWKYVRATRHIDFEAVRKRGLAPGCCGCRCVLAQDVGCLSPFSDSLLLVSLGERELEPVLSQLRAAGFRAKTSPPAVSRYLTEWLERLRLRQEFAEICA
jgi:hypothetical protein